MKPNYWQSDDKLIIKSHSQSSNATMVVEMLVSEINETRMRIFKDSESIREIKHQSLVIINSIN